MDTEDRVPRIKELKIHVKADHYLALAHAEIAKGNNVEAIEYYMLYIWNLANPHDMKLVEQINLTKLIMNLRNTMEDSFEEDQNEVMKCFLSVLNRFPENALLLNAFGCFFFSQGEYTVSRSYFQRAAAAGYLPGEKNFLHVIWHLIPRWHFRMLNDKKRNESYKKAIEKAVSEGFKKVYDIGAGCGLLTLIAASTSKDTKVVAFEESKILSGIASNVFKRNNLTENVRLIDANSNETTIPPAPCNLIVTEIFDAGVFGENCLKTIKHALDHFLSEEKFKIIPERAKLYVTAFQSQEITRKYRYTETLPELGLENICLTEVDPEPYDAEYLKNKNVQFMTDTKSFLNVNFYDSTQLEKLLTPDNNYFDPLELTCKKTGIIHALAVWFDLNLDEEVTISTHPENSENRCWEQAVFHLDHPIKVKSGDILKVRPTILDGRVSFEILSPKTECEECMIVSKEIISFLNDVKLVQSIIQAANSYENPDLRIVDFNVFPLFGFLMAKKGATVYHVYKDDCDLILFNHLIIINELPPQKLILIHHRSVEEYMIVVEPPHVVYTDLIKTDGSWNKTELTLETEEKLNCESLPKKIFLNAQLVSSTYLDVCNKVNDDNALNFQIFAEINEYSGSEHPNLDSFEHVTYSTVVTFDISDLEKFDFHLEGTVTSDGICNGILYWFDIQFTDDENNKFSTLDSTHYDKCCTLLSNPKCVKKGDQIMFHIMRFEGHLKVYCD